MSWSLQVIGAGHDDAREQFAMRVEQDQQAPRDGRLEAAADQLMSRMPAGRVSISSSGHLGDNGYGTASVSVTVPGPTLGV